MISSRVIFNLEWPSALSLRAAILDLGIARDIFQNEQNVTDIRKWLYAPNFRDMQPSMPIFAVVSHPKVVTEPVATLSIVFHYPTNVALIPHYL